MAEKTTNHRGAALKWRRTKIVATLGPSSDTRAMIDKLIGAGVDVVRINLSHGDRETHRKTIQLVRLAEARAGRHVGVLMDLCGPKIRVGEFENGGIRLSAGDSVVVTTRKCLGRDGLIPSQYRSLYKGVVAGRPCCAGRGVA